MQSGSVRPIESFESFLCRWMKVAVSRCASHGSRRRGSSCWIDCSNRTTALMVLRRRCVLYRPAERPRSLVLGRRRLLNKKNFNAS